MKTIKIPKALQELHGENSPLFNIILVYFIGLIAFFLVFLSLENSGISLIKRIIVSFIFFDIAGGVIANLSSSTNQYYQKNERIRIIFLLLHILHPAVVIWVFPSSWILIGGVAALTLMGGVALHFIPDNEKRQVLAAALLVLGVLGSLYLQAEVQVLYAFAPLFMVKLLIGFSVKRPVLEP